MKTQILGNYSHYEISFMIILINVILITVWLEMTSKDDLVQWNLATSFYDKGELHSAIKKFQNIKFSAKICFNIGQAYFFLGYLDLAINAFSEAIQKDEHFTASYFQRGIVYFSRNRYVDAQSDFETALDKLRSKEFIDYKQIGFQKIYAYQILQNLIAVNALRNDFFVVDSLLYKFSTLSQKPKQSDIEYLNYLVKGRHNIPIYKLPQEAIFRLSNSISSNLEKKNYLGEAKVLHCANPVVDLTKINSLCLSEERSSPQFSRSKITSEKFLKPEKYGPISKSCPTSHIAHEKPIQWEKVSGSSSIDQSHVLLPISQSSPKFTKSKIASEKFLKPEKCGPVSNSCPTSPHIEPKKPIQRKQFSSFSSIDQTHVLLPKDQSSPKFTRNKIVSEEFLKLEKYGPIYKHCRISHSAPGKTIPNKMVSSVSSSDQTVQMIALYDFDGERNDLTFQRGDIINVIGQVNADWIKGELHGKQGVFPASYAKPFQSCKSIQLFFQNRTK